MKRTVSALILAVCMLFSAVSFAETAPTEVTVPLHTEVGEDIEMALRFFEGTPDIPYMGMNEFWTKILRDPLTVEKSGEGTLILKNDRGGELVCDAAAGTIYAPDWVRMTTPQMPIENGAHSLKDSNCRFIRITDVTYEGEPTPVTFDFAKYGMKIYADDSDVYLPVSTLSNMTTDIATNHLRYDWKDLYQMRFGLEAVTEDPILINERMKAWLAGEDRPADLIRQTYADLCFNLDYFFGYPGKAPLDPAMAEKGLDQALTDLGEEGAAIKEGLLSPSMIEYMGAMVKLFMIWLSDGHTVPSDLMTMLYDDSVASNWGMTKDYYTSLLQSKVTMSQLLNMSTVPQRALAWGDDVYRECGNTAIIRLDTFMPDEAAWDLWYKGEGPFPEDCVGIVVSGLRRAQENENIKNVIFDLTCNDGGSSDVLLMILGLTTGQNQLYGVNKLTNQRLTVTCESDNNFDGVFDEKDQEARFDFNYGVLTTRHAFSCGNLFPIIMREGGAVVLGERTSGGSCCVEVGEEAQGIRYMMSSYQWQLVDSTGKDVEGGCTVDIPIQTWSIGLLDKLIGKLGVDEDLPIYNAYYDDESLNTLMNTWFHETEELAPAA